MGTKSTSFGGALVAAVLTCALGTVCAYAAFDLNWYTIDSGGETSAGGSFQLSGTIGQPDAGMMSGGSFTLTGGFWAIAAPQTTPGDMNCDGVINNFDINGFVLALTNPAAYQAMYPDCNILNADCNGDGLVNNFDINPFVALLVGS